MSQQDVTQSGHSIEARVYAEDPSNGFLPSIGELAVWRPPSGPGIRVDSGVREGDSVTIEFDPMLAKLIVHASDRSPRSGGWTARCRPSSSWASGRTSTS